MNSGFRPATAADEGRLIEFLARAFGAARDAPFIEPSLMRWKYWEPREDCAEPRSVVIERDGRIVAHAGLWPVTVGVGGRSERGVHMIDWASDAAAPGAGASLLQRLTKNYDFVLAIGGSEATQSVLPMFGFREVDEALTWARPIRPWRQMVRHRSRGARLPLRLVRNWWWSKTPARAIDRGWSAVEAGGEMEPLVGARERDAPFFRYLARCPAARSLTFHVEREGRRIGFFGLTIVGEQARLSGVWLEDESAGNLRAAFQLAQRAAIRHAGASEFVARGAGQASAAAAQEAGLRVRARNRVFVYRRGGGAAPLPLRFQMADDDHVFLGGPPGEFLT